MGGIWGPFQQTNSIHLYWHFYWRHIPLRLRPVSRCAADRLCADVRRHFPISRCQQEPDSLRYPAEDLVLLRGSGVNQRVETDLHR